MQLFGLLWLYWCREVRESSLFSQSVLGIGHVLELDALPKAGMLLLVDGIADGITLMHCVPPVAMHEIC